MSQPPVRQMIREAVEELGSPTTNTRRQVLGGGIGLKPIRPKSNLLNYHKRWLEHHYMWYNAATMETTGKTGEVALRLFGRTRHAILGLLYARPDREFYQQEITQAAGVNLSAVQRELQNLVEAGLVTQRQDGRRVYYQANRVSPLFPDLQGIVLKTVGLADVLREALEPVREKIEVAFVFGSLAAGNATAGSDVDLMVIGRVGLREIAPLLSAAADTLGREVNPVTASPAEWADRLHRGDHFINTVAREPKIFVLGATDELERVGGEGSAAEA